MALKNISTQIEKLFEERLQAIAKELKYSDDDLKALLEVNKKMSSTPRTRKPRDPTLPKPPNNGYIRYCAVMRPKIKLSNPEAKGPEVMKLLGARWQAEPQSVKDKYNNEYKADKAEYDRKVKQIKAEQVDDDVVEVEDEPKESPKESPTDEPKESLKESPKESPKESTLPSLPRLPPLKKKPSV